jgi:hypothetical protein
MTRVGCPRVRRDELEERLGGAEGNNRDLSSCVDLTCEKTSASLRHDVCPPRARAGRS